MCLGAIVQARLRRVFYGASDPKAGAVRSTMRFPFAKLNHRPEITGGLLSEECGRAADGFLQGQTPEGRAARDASGAELLIRPFAPSAERWPSG